MNRSELINDLWELQGERCGICGNQTRSLVVDHDHGSRLIRGLLCAACNHAEGRHGRECDYVDGCPICTWRHQPAVVWLGYSVAYSDDITLRNWIPGFAPAADLIEARRVADRDCANIIDAHLASLRVTPAAVEACFGITVNDTEQAS